MKGFSIILTILLNNLYLAQTVDLQLKHVFVLFRHGDRSPIHFLDHVKGYRSQDWPIGPGQLTEKGMKQEFELGKFLSQRYDNMISPNYDRNEIWVRSSDYERTLMSAESVLAGLYFADRRNDSELNKIHPNLNWLPIPIHTKFSNRDVLLLSGKCPYHDRLSNRISLDYDAEMSSQDKETLMKLMQQMQYEMSSPFKFAQRIYDTLYCGQQNEKKLPDYVSSDIFRRLEYFSDLKYYLHYNTLQKDKMARIMGGILLNDIINKTKQVADKRKDMLGKNLTIYSAHDTDVAFLLSILGSFNYKQPPYCASVIIEISCDKQYCDEKETQMKHWYVHLFYRNDTNMEPYPLPLPKCPGVCNLNDFIYGYMSMTITDKERQDLCQKNLSEFLGIVGWKLWIVVLVAGISVILLIVLGICCRTKSAETQFDQYSLLPNQFR